MSGFAITSRTNAMVRFTRHIFAIGALVALLAPWPAMGTILGLSKREIHDVTTLARAISDLQPKLPDAKYVDYALGIYKAAKRYKIDPRLLIAIAHQETSFRENLPEGAAGEIGICQIRKLWLKNDKFRKEFGNRTLRDLRNPEKNFLFAAWILRDLKDTADSSHSVPWWTYYNARKLKNRVTYYMHVNKKLARIQKYGPVADSERAPASGSKRSPEAPEKIAAVGNIHVRGNPAKRESKRALPKTRASVPAKQLSAKTYHASVAQNRWLSDTIDSLKQRAAVAPKAKWSGHHGTRKTASAVTRAEPAEPVAN